MTLHATAGVIGGYQFNKYFSLETRFNIGISGYSSICACGEQNKEHVYKQDIDQQASLFIKGSYSISDSFSIFALAGVSKSTYKLETKSHKTYVQGNSTITQVTFSDSGELSESGFSYGLGLSYQITEAFSLFIDYQILPELIITSGDSFSWKNASLGINYAF